MLHKLLVLTYETFFLNSCFLKSQLFRKLFFNCINICDFNYILTIFNAKTKNKHAS